MKATVLLCPNCGGVADGDALRCLYCAAQLRTAACGACFALAFVGTKHCPDCGCKLTEGLTQIDPGGPRPDCPRCKVPLDAVLLSGTRLDECTRCGGLWVEQTVFEAICAQRERGATIRAFDVGSVLREPEGSTPVQMAAYVPCPLCKKLMNRTNFARISGVIIDSCKGHGTWFDRNELQSIIAFVEAGGLDHARAREKAKLEDARRREAERRLEAAKSGDGSEAGRSSSWAEADAGDVLTAIGAAIYSLFR